MLKRRSVLALVKSRTTRESPFDANQFKLKDVKITAIDSYSESFETCCHGLEEA